MIVYRLVDIRLGFACNTPAVIMTPAKALETNRNLLLAGQRSIGWIEATRVADDGRLLPAELVKPAPVKSTPKPPAPEPSPDLIDALVALGYKQRKARELAANAAAGNVSEQLAALFSKQGATA